MPPMEHLKALGARMYPDLSKRLKEQTGIDNGFMVSGGLEVLMSDHDAGSEEWRGHGAAFELKIRKVSGFVRVTSGSLSI